MRAPLRCRESMAKHCAFAASSEASATTVAVAASMAAVAPARKQSWAAAWSRATADTGRWRSGRKKKARSRSLMVNRHPGKNSEHRRYKCGYIADSASFSGLDSWNYVSDAITWKDRESRRESIREGEDRSSKRSVSVGRINIPDPRIGFATRRVARLFQPFGLTQKRSQLIDESGTLLLLLKAFKVSVRSGRRISCRKDR